MITEEQVEIAKEELVKLITDMLKENKKVGPIVSLIVEDSQSIKPGVMIFPVPGILMRSKQLFREQLLPQIKEKVIEERTLKVHGSCVIMEANMWVAMKKDNEVIDEAEVRKEAPTDILLFTFEDKYGSNIVIYEVTKHSFVNGEGELETGEIEVTLRDDLTKGGDDIVSIEGALGSIFKYFWEAE